MTDLLGQQPACVADLAGKRRSLPQQPLIAGVRRIQSKYRVFEPQEEVVCRLITELNIGRIVGEQIDSLAFGVLPQQLSRLSRFRPIPTQYLVEPKD